MSERNFTPPEQYADMFEAITSGLDGHVTDPFLDEVHGVARQYQAELRAGEVTVARQNEILHHLNEAWNEYSGRTVTVTGYAWSVQPGEERMIPAYYEDQPAISGGFTIVRQINADDLIEISVAHRLSLEKTQGREMAFMPIDDVHHIELPYPSDERRVHRFAYNYPEEAQQLRELVATTARDDQLLRDLQEFSLMVDLDSPEGIDDARDAEKYLNQTATIDTLANYVVELAPAAPVLLPSGDNLLVYTDFPKGYTMALHYDQLVLRPRDVRTAERTGQQELVPYVEGQILLPQANQDIVIPCSSIAGVHSLRYGGYPSTLLPGDPA